MLCIHFLDDRNGSEFFRHSVNTEIRNRHNDVYLHYYQKAFKYVDGEYQIRQKYSLFAFRGSVQLSDEESNMFRSGLMNEPTSKTPRDITLVSQTSFHLYSSLIYRIERFFFLPSLLQRWKGFLFYVGLIISPISITVFVRKEALTALTEQIRQSHFPPRLLLSLYVHLFQRTKITFRIKPELLYHKNMKIASDFRNFF